MGLGGIRYSLSYTLHHYTNQVDYQVAIVSAANATVHAVGSPFTVVGTPSVPAAVNTVVSPGPSTVGGVVGNVLTLQAQLRDKHLNLLTKGGDSCTLKLAPVGHSVAASPGPLNTGEGLSRNDNGDGTYSMAYNIEYAGLFTLVPWVGAWVRSQTGPNSIALKNK